MRETVPRGWLSVAGSVAKSAFRPQRQSYVSPTPWMDKTPLDKAAHLGQLLDQDTLQRKRGSFCSHRSRLDGAPHASSDRHNKRLTTDRNGYLSALGISLQTLNVRKQSPKVYRTCFSSGACPVPPKLGAALKSRGFLDKPNTAQLNLKVHRHKYWDRRRQKQFGLPNRPRTSLVAK